MKPLPAWLKYLMLILLIILILALGVYAALWWILWGW